MNEPTPAGSGPRIYNLFPLLAGPLPRWTPHLERARSMGFEWIFINPFHLSGFSGSLYSIKDYYSIDSRFVDPASEAPETQLIRMIETARGMNLKIVMDLVINHTAFDSPLVDIHPTWYKRGADGKPVHPGAREGDHVVTWGDLFEIDNRTDRDGLWDYWRKLAAYYAKIGIGGFRCDAAYKVPAELWRKLIGSTKQSYPDVVFLAESLGCPVEDTVRLAQSGFDFIFNSSKWWDFSAPWCLEQYRRTADLVPSISFPESHDTERLAAELKGDLAAVKTRYAFAALFSTGVMMPIGFEFGFARRLSVVRTRPEDWEKPAWNICAFVAGVNRLKASRRVFNEEGPIDSIEVGNPHVLALVKWSRDRRERALIVLNKNRLEHQSFRLQSFGPFLAGTARVDDVSPDGAFQHSPDFQTCFLKPSAFHVLWAQAA